MHGSKDIPENIVIEAHKGNLAYRRKMAELWEELASAMSGLSCVNSIPLNPTCHPSPCTFLLNTTLVFWLPAQDLENARIKKVSLMFFVRYKSPFFFNTGLEAHQGIED
jgi:hypothetical protein